MNDMLIPLYIDRLAEINGDDPALSHPKADDILCDLLDELGYHEVVVEYKKIDKWYE